MRGDQIRQGVAAIHEWCQNPAAREYQDLCQQLSQLTHGLHTCRKKLRFASAQESCSQRSTKQFSTQDRTVIAPSCRQITSQATIGGVAQRVIDHVIGLGCACDICAGVVDHMLAPQIGDCRCAAGAIAGRLSARRFAGKTLRFHRELICA